MKKPSSMKKRTPSARSGRASTAEAFPVAVFIEEYDMLRRAVDGLRASGKRIVLTQGVFDLIHEGHAAYLARARAHGDVLIVGVDSDALTRQRKGPNRPIVPQTERITMLRHLRPVDIVTLRDIKHGIGGLIELVKPDVLVASASTADFKKDQVHSYRKMVGDIVILPPQGTTSTTARIRHLTIDGAETLAKEVHAIVEDFLSRVRNG
jgi:rfaE bifunctional protein nucleotidyltransferase chain/domain